MLALAGGLGAAPAVAHAGTVDVVVTLKAPPLARAVEQSRALSASAKRSRLDVRSPLSAAHLRTLGEQQDVLAARIERRIPGARVRWRYRIVLNGLAVTLPERRLPALRSLPGVGSVVGATRYSVTAGDSSAAAAAAAAPAALSADGAGVKIAVLDEGVDQSHPFFSPAGFAYPPGFPKGNRNYTTPKVIVARAFAPSSPKWKYAGLPFDPQFSEHGTHVAGIAAGNANVSARGTAISGVAPRAQIGNYKVLTTPTAGGFGLNGNSPEIAAGIEAAVADGMDVINLSLGEPEVEPTRDLVARAVDAAVDAGVVVTISAGNSGELGPGSVGSPGSAAKALTVAAAVSRTGIAGFSSIGPTPLSLRPKPEIAAPGVDVLSSVPARTGLWARFSGTSMASPHVAGLAALLIERYPGWTPAQVKSALVQTAAPASAGPARAGAGMADVARAAEPLLFADPIAVSFGLVPRGGTALRGIELADAGGGAGAWSVAVDRPGDANVVLSAPAAVTVPGRLDLTLAAGQAAGPGTHTGFVTLTRGAETRRVPYWLRVSARRLAGHRVTVVSRAGVYRGNTAGRPALVDGYRFPEAGFVLPGPEQVFRLRLPRPAANVGVVVLGRARGVDVQPRIVLAGDEDRMTGAASLPLDLNPYRTSYGSSRPVAGALLPRAEAYDLVFDTPAGARAGRFSFRLWIGDTKPPKVRPLTRVVRRGAPLRLAASDPGGSGIDPRSIDARVGGRKRAVSLRAGVLRIATRGLAPGRHRLVLALADFQETKNDENVSRILPNTRRLTLAFRVTR